MDQFDPWQVVPSQVFTPFSRLLISTAFIVSRVGCLRVTDVIKWIFSLNGLKLLGGVKLTEYGIYTNTNKRTN